MQYFLVLLFFLLTSSELFAENAKVTVLKRSLLANEKIEAKIAELSKQNYDRKTIIADNLPKVEYVYNSFESKLHNINVDGIREKTRIDTSTFAANQEIFNPNLYPLYKVNKQTTSLITKEIDQLISQTLLETITSLIDLQIIKSKQQMLESNLKLAKEIYEIMKVKREVGQSSELDLLNAKQNVINNETALIDNERAKISKLAELEKLTNLKHFADYDFQEELDKFQIMPLSETLNEANISNQELQIKNTEILIQKANKSLEKSDFLPSANIYYQHNTTDGGFSFINQGYTKETEETYGVKVTVPLFASGKNFYQIEGANALIEKTSANYAYSKDSVKEEITSLYNDLDFSDKIIAQNVEATKLAKMSLKAAKEEYLSGKLDFTDLLSSQNKLLASENDLLSSRLDKQKLHYSLIYLLGKLTPEFFDFNFYLK